MVEVPNFTPGSGARLATDRYDFQKHVVGTDFQHTADIIVLSPAISVNGDPASTNLQEVITQINALVPQVIPDASSSTKGLIQLAGDLAAGTAASPVVTGLRGFPIQNATPNSGDILTWTGAFWTPQALTNTFTTLTVTGLSTLSGTVAASGPTQITGSLLIYTPATVTITATGSNHDVVITSGRDIDLNSFDDIHLTTSGSATSDIILDASRNANITSNSGNVNINSVSGTTNITSDGSGINIETGSNISIAATGSGIISIDAGYALSINAGSGGVAINSGDFSVTQSVSVNQNLLVFGATSLNGNATLGGSASDLTTVRSVMKFNSTARIQYQGISLNNANQSINILQYKYLVSPSTVSAIRTYTLTDSSSSTDGDWFQIYNASSFNHVISGVVSFTLTAGSTRHYLKIGGVWTRVSDFN